MQLFPQVTYEVLRKIRGTMGGRTFYLFFSAAGACSDLVVFFFFSRMTLLL